METDLTDHCKAAQMQISSRIHKVEEVWSTRTTADSLVEERETTRELPKKQRIYQITDQPEHEKNIRKV